MALPAGLSACAMCVELKYGTATGWTDVSDEVSVLTPDALAKPTAEFYVLGEIDAGLLAGKNGPTNITLRGIWTDTTAGQWYSIWSQWTTGCAGKVQVRWSPGGCTTAHLAWATHSTYSHVASFTPPGGDGASAEALVWEAVIATSALTVAAWA